MKNLLYVLSLLAMIGLIAWILVDESWIDIWVFNKEIIMTNLAKWVPVAVMWSASDNIIDRLFHGTKVEAWMKKKFT